MSATSGTSQPRQLSDDAAEPVAGTTRRRFIGYVLGGATLAVTADLSIGGLSAQHAHAAGVQPLPQPSNPIFGDVYDFLDTMRDIANETHHLLRIELQSDGTAHFAMPRQEVGQGITTAISQMIGDELDLPLEQVKVTLADARPELIHNQLTGGSTAVYSLFLPIKIMAATARTALVQAASAQWGVSAKELTTRRGAVFGPGGRMATYGSLAERAASVTTRSLEVELKSTPGNLIGKSVGRVDALDAITGAKKFTMDLKIPNALPTMICRPPTFNGKVKAVRNLEKVAKMPGVTDVGVVSTGVAVRAETFGQCIDAVRALDVDWGPGTKDADNNATIIDQVAAVQLPMAPFNPAGETIDETFVFHPRSGSAMETNNAIADVREDSAEVWGVFKMPIVTLQRIALQLGMPESAVTVHCITGGGSFGRHLFSDAAYEAVEASKLFGKPVKLMWHRADDARHGRMHPTAVCRVAATVVGGTVTDFQLRLASGAMDVSHGLGEIFSGSAAAQDPRLGFTGNKQYGNLTTSIGFFNLITQVPYNFGATNLALNEVFNFDDFPTGAVRNVWAPDMLIARELVVEKLAEKLGMGPFEFRRAFVKHDNFRRVMDVAAEAANWGKTMPEGTAQAIVVHQDFKAFTACIMELDARPRTVNRKIRDAYTGPRVTRATIVVDVGNPINPRGIETQMLGGMIEGISNALSAVLHIEDGLPLEASWDDYRFARQWNTPLKSTCIVMPKSSEVPGGVGELGVSPAGACAAVAFAKATKTFPTEWPPNVRKPLGFKVKSKVPPIPASPTNGLRLAR
ncbi:MAG: molybdopterin cofactor-binding domain-containing protein [Sporichthyaceae bacterium]